VTGACAIPNLLLSLVVDDSFISGGPPCTAIGLFHLATHPIKTRLQSSPPDGTKSVHLKDYFDAIQILRKGPS